MSEALSEYSSDSDGEREREREIESGYNSDWKEEEDGNKLATVTKKITKDSFKNKKK